MEFENSPEWARQLKAEHLGKLQDDHEAALYRQLYHELARPLPVGLPESFPLAVTGAISRNQRWEWLTKWLGITAMILIVCIGIFTSYPVLIDSLASLALVIGDAPWLMLGTALLIVATGSRFIIEIMVGATNHRL